MLVGWGRKNCRAVPGRLRRRAMRRVDGNGGSAPPGAEHDSQLPGQAMRAVERHRNSPPILCSFLADAWHSQLFILDRDRLACQGFGGAARRFSPGKGAALASRQGLCSGTPGGALPLHPAKGLRPSRLPFRAWRRGLSPCAVLVAMQHVSKPKRERTPRRFPKGDRKALWSPPQRRYHASHCLKDI